MRSFLLAAFLIPLSAFGQLAQPVAAPVVPPSDPLEPITGEVQTISTVEQRGALRALLNRAADQYSLHSKGTPPHILDISFNAAASTQFPAGEGRLRETWLSGQSWRWDAALGAYSLLRIIADGVAYDEQTPRPIPLRLKMLANAVFAPLQPTLLTRTASATVKGTQVTCALASPNGDRQSTASPASGRHWDEIEYCIDPATSRLMLFSEAPGIYVTYDYTKALRFHNRTLPGTVTVTENGNVVLRADLTGIADADTSNVSPVTPTAQMKAHGPAVVLNMPMRFTNPVMSADVPPGAPIQPTVVHVTFDEHGAVQESEALQTSSWTARALNAVTSIKFGPAQNAQGLPPVQREAYILVEFVPEGLGRFRRIQNDE